MRDGGSVFLRGVHQCQKRKEERSPAWLAWKSGPILCLFQYKDDSISGLGFFTSEVLDWSSRNSTLSFLASKSPEIWLIIFRKRQDELIQIMIATNSNNEWISPCTYSVARYCMKCFPSIISFEPHNNPWDMSVWQQLICLNDYCELSASGHTVGLQFLILWSLAVLYDLRWLLSSEQHWWVPRLGWAFVLALYPPRDFFLC